MMEKFGVESYSHDSYKISHVPGRSVGKYNRWTYDEIDAVLDQVREILENSLSGIYCIHILNNKFKPEESEGLNKEQAELAQLMSDISEQSYAAGWMSGNEYRIWSMLKNNILIDGAYSFSVEQRNNLIFLSKKIGGWIFWDDETYYTFIDAEAWAHKYECDMPRVSQPENESPVEPVPPIDPRAEKMTWTREELEEIIEETIREGGEPHKLDLGPNTVIRKGG